MAEWKSRNPRRNTTQRLVQVRNGTRAWLWALAGILAFFGIIALLVIFMTFYALNFN